MLTSYLCFKSIFFVGINLMSLLFHKLCLEEKHLVVSPNQKYDLQQWDKWHQYLARCVSGLITGSTEWVQYWRQIRLTGN